MFDPQSNRGFDKRTGFEKYFQSISVPAKTILLKGGEVSGTMFFVERGCLRTWVNCNGKDITTRFFFEGSFVSSIESFRNNQPSLYNIESIEPSEVQTITKKDFDFVVENTPSIKKELEEHLFGRLVQGQRILLSLLRDTPQTRYEELVECHPEIIQRVPQHYIASYLGITPVSLSRIRNRRRSIS